MSHFVYVIVAEKKNIQDVEFYTALSYFLSDLQVHGLQLTIKYNHEQLTYYILLELPRKVGLSLADIYNIDIHTRGHNYCPLTAKIDINFFHTPLSSNRDIFVRTNDLTSMEKILIINELLKDSNFGPSDSNSGVEKLIALGVVNTAFPLHDGPYKTPDNFEEPLNDRQLLLKHWASFGLWYKDQPLNLIEKYYGSEVAFYFAWLGFYNQMLISASIAGVVCFLASAGYLVGLNHERKDEICTSELVMCPLCHSGANCVFKPLKDTCAYATVSILFDNYTTVVFAVLMSVWATCVTNFWKRIENILKIRWNVAFVESDVKIRPGYKTRNSRQRVSEVTAELELYTPAYSWVFFMGVSYAITLFLVLIVGVAVFGVIMYRILLGTLIRIGSTISAKQHASLIILSTSAILQVIFIKLFGLLYGPLSVWLTQIENPRTQSDFDTSVVHKRYLLAFVNNYASLFYLAFFKGRFFRPNHKPSLASIELDICHPTGCLVALCTQLGFLLIFKSLVGNILTLIWPGLMKFFKGKPRCYAELPHYEFEARHLKPTTRYLLTSEFVEMVIQYGFVTFFVAAFPLAPLCALINNCLELRLDAYKLVTRYRRPVPKQQSGIGPWQNILTAITHLSVATNAFVLAFTSDSVSREIYRNRHRGSLEGYIESTLSVYDMKDFGGEPPLNPYQNTTLCHYHASRHPPNHPRKYELTPAFWQDLGMRLICVLIFEHLIWILNRIVSYFTPEIPNSVKLKRWHDNNIELELKLRAKQLENEKRKPKRQISKELRQRKADSNETTDGNSSIV